MKKKAIILFMCFTALSWGVSFAQPQRPVSSAPQTEVQRPREIKADGKKEELSKKLLQRKNELRREERQHNKEHRNSETKEKSNNSK
jgi:hypothetical protein